MTKKIYYDNPYLTEFESEVLSCTQGKKGYEIILPRTAFYPEGGGQLCDKGIFAVGETEIEVTEVHEKGEIITHYCTAPIQEGTKVKGIIDWARRYDLMQQHTGEHMFSGVIHNMFGYNNVGFHLSETDVVVDFDGVLSKEDIKAVQDRCNEIAWLNQPVTATFPDNVKQMSYRSKKEIEGAIRIVTAGDADICACCGTHVAHTSEAAPVVALSSQNYKGGTRITMLSGKRAVEYLKQRNDDCYRISHLLAVPVEDIVGGVQKRLGEIEKLKAQLSDARRQLFSVWADAAKTENGVAITAKDDLSAAECQKLASMLCEKAPTALVYSYSADSTSKLCIISTEKDTNKLGRHISATLGGKGGGKPGIYQGFVEKPTTEEQLSEIVKTFEG